MYQKHQIQVIERYISENGKYDKVSVTDRENNHISVLDVNVSFDDILKKMGSDWVNRTLGDIAIDTFLKDRGLTGEEFRIFVLSELDLGRCLRAWVMPDLRDGGVYPFQPYWTDTQEFMPYEILRGMFKDGTLEWKEPDPRGWADLRLGDPIPNYGM